MRILFLNQYFPPDPAPTGALLKELADALALRGHSVDLVAAGADYRGGQEQKGRVRREAAALWRMLLAGFRQPRPAVIVSASSPPCLLVVATLLAAWHRARSIHWAMDLYPDLALALGELRSNTLARAIDALVGWCYRRASRVVTLDEDMAARIRRHGVDAVVIRPWVLESVLPHLARAVGRTDPEGQWTWIYSGNLGRAHEWETLLAAQARLESMGSPIWLRVQGGGPARAAAQERAQQLGLRQVEWLGYVPESDLPASLLRCHVLVVTQLPQVRGMLWPSKLGLVASLPRPLVWVGPVETAITRELRCLPQAAVFAPGQSGELAEWLNSLEQRGSLEMSPVLNDAPAERQASIAAWCRIVEAK